MRRDDECHRHGPTHSPGVHRRHPSRPRRLPNVRSRQDCGRRGTNREAQPSRHRRRHAGRRSGAGSMQQQRQAAAAPAPRPPAAPQRVGGRGTGSSAQAGGIGGAPTCSSGTLSAEGSTAQTNAMTAWINAYTKACTSAKINYNPTGSGAGVTSFTGGQVDFAGSDSALDPTKGEVAAAQKRCGSAPIDLPMVVGPIAIAYNLKGVTKLVLTPAAGRQDLHRQDHQVERPGDQGQEQRRIAAEHGDQRDLPLGRVRHHAERREVPRRHRPGRLQGRAGQGQRRPGVQGPGQGEVAGRRRRPSRAPTVPSATTSTPSRSAAACRRRRSTAGPARWT